MMRGGAGDSESKNMDKNSAIKNTGKILTSGSKKGRK